MEKHRGRHSFDRVGAERLDGVLASLTNPFAKHYYVDPVNGDDGGNGGAFDDAFASMQVAVDACEDWKGDIIHVAKGTQTVTEAVEFDCPGIVVVADTLTQPWASGERHVIYGSHTDGPAAKILQPCTIMGMGFCGSQAAGASLEFDCDEEGSWAGGWSLVYRCRLTHWGIAKAYAVLVKGTGENAIVESQFDGLWTGYTQAAIGLADSGDQGVWNLVLAGNRFYNVGSGKYCIQLASGCHFRQGIVEDNVNIGSGKFFNAAGQSGDAIFRRNFVGGATDTGSYNTTVSTLQTAGFEFSENEYAE